MRRLRKTSWESSNEPIAADRRRFAMVDPALSAKQLRALESCRDQESLALDQLRAALVRPSTLAKDQSLLPIVEILMDTLSRHWKAASEGGYMSDITRERPNWQRQIDSLRGANFWCISSLAELRDDLKHRSFTPFDSAEVQVDLHTWMHSLASIRQCEALVLQRAYSLDFGGEA
jgi:hypothetical protein